MEDILMIIVLKPNSTNEQVARVEQLVKMRGLDTHIVVGTGQTIIGCIGDTSRIDSKLFEVDPAVTKVMHVQEPYKLASRASTRTTPSSMCQSQGWRTIIWR